MAWTEFTRAQHARKGDKYASDPSDAERALIPPLMPPRRTTGCQWRMRPNDFPPVSTVRGCLHAWRDDGLRDGMNRKLVEVARPAGIHGAGIQDRNGTRDVLKAVGRWTVQIVKHADGSSSAPLPDQGLGKIHRQCGAMGDHRPHSPRHTPEYRKFKRLISRFQAVPTASPSLSLAQI